MAVADQNRPLSVVPDSGHPGNSIFLRPTFAPSICTGLQPQHRVFQGILSRLASHRAFMRVADRSACPRPAGSADHPGSIPLALMIEIAAGVVRYLMKACAAVLSLALVLTAPVRTM